jgi:hypothetical protein
MIETIELGDILITVTRKKAKNVHLSVYPPEGRVTLVAPKATRLEVTLGRMRSRGLLGFGDSRRRLRGRPANQPANLSNARATTSGDAGIC